MANKGKKQKSVEPVPETSVVEQTIDETVLNVPLPDPSFSPPEEPPSVVEETTLALTPDEGKEVKVKAKRKPQPTKIEVKDIPEETTPVESKEIKVEEPKKKVKTLEQVQCDTCEKEMTKRTLRYHHKCPGEVVKREEVPVKKRVKKETKKEEETSDANVSTVNRRNEQQSTPEKQKLIPEYHERLQKALEQRNQTIIKLASQIV